ncbi:unnamed protein product [Closterium sp. NIES-65]|nr:unnamed protein product [Closterium sp. NIES-65]
MDGYNAYSAFPPFKWRYSLQVVVIFVKAGDGGNGAVLHPPRPWKAGETPGLKGGKLNAREAEELRRKLRRDAAGLTIVPIGGHGGDIVIHTDPSLSTLLPLPLKPPTCRKEAEKAKAMKKEAEKAKAMKRVGTFKRDADGLAIVPMGGHGGDIVIYADPSLSTLLPLHRKKRHVARSGGHVDAKGGLARRGPDGLQGPVLRIGVPVGTLVKRKPGGKFLADLANPPSTPFHHFPPLSTSPPGTVVKRKRGGKFLADLANPGDEVVVARGGRGGVS